MVVSWSIVDCRVARCFIEVQVFNIAVVAGNEKAFVQIGLNSDDSDYVRFLWFANVNKINFLNLNNIKLVVYRFSRVFVGVASSPLLLSTTLISHITQFYHLDPKFAVSLLNSLQVNDMSGGSHTIYWAFDFFMKCEESLALRGSQLQKFQ